MLQDDPIVPPQQELGSRKPKRHLSIPSALRFAYNWLLWGFFTLLIYCQALGIAWTKFTEHVDLYFGQDPSLGLYQVLGTNDAPFTDRSFVCALRGRIYKPAQLQEALNSPSASIVDTSGSAVNGYRVMKRTEFHISEFTMTAYMNTCELIASTMDAVFDRCGELGYNVTRDALRIVEGAQSTTMKLLPDTLPVIVMPFTDDSLYSRYAIPGWDGSACMFRLNGAYETRGYPDMAFRGVIRSVRERKTVELLKRPGGVWRNGWYEDLEGGRWYSEVMSTDNTSLEIRMREFDMARNTERDCMASSSICGKMTRLNWWGTQLSAADDSLWYTSVTTLNAKHYGVFIFEGSVMRWSESVYNLDMIVANLSLGALLIRWMVVKIAVLRLSLVPLLFSKRTDHHRRGTATTTAIEETLALHLVSSGGLGPMTASVELPSSAKSPHKEYQEQRIPLLSSFELLRMGYLVMEKA